MKSPTEFRNQQLQQQISEQEKYGNVLNLKNSQSINANFLLKFNWFSTKRAVWENHQNWLLWIINIINLFVTSKNKTTNRRILFSHVFAMFFTNFRFSIFTKICKNRRYSNILFQLNNTFCSTLNSWKQDS